ncbi:MAG: type II toxin-antitoxin system RelE/ParE family toxin [Gemmatimonadetes bacterium]|nr:type II toxin-antitoxin system RelE/ParE family toxin [Gemmatimonadota bacterium]MCH8305452.1 type II toxin-antitoxin system RelE/ParE family toxin [Candidatus Neomarinimicrobiota bacterium]
MVEVIVHPAALAELTEASAFYEERAPGLGRDLFEEAVRVFQLIGENPSIAAEFEEPYRRYLCRRFPFSVVYRESRGGVRVLAVMHQRRRPGYWKSSD